MDADSLKRFLQARGLKPNITYGQNFLVDDIVLEDMVEAAGVAVGDNVLEIGPGTGVLTERLLAAGANVLSVEKDPKFLPVLHRISKGFRDHFRYEVADALSFDYVAALKERGWLPYKVVANIPYYVTGKLLPMFLTARVRPESVTVLVQEEVARSAAAGAGDTSLLSLSVQIYGVPRLVRRVPAESFYPKPKVNSAVLHVDVYREPLTSPDEEQTLFRIARACFSGKRKQIHNTLKSNLDYSPERVELLLATVGVERSARPQSLSLEQWLKLARTAATVR